MVRSIVVRILTLQNSWCDYNSGNTRLSTAGDGSVSESTWYWHLANTTAPVRWISTTVSMNLNNFDYNWSVLHIVRTMHLKIPQSIWSQFTSLSWLPSFLPVTILNPINRTIVFGDWLELVHPLGGTYYHNTNKVSAACRSHALTSFKSECVHIGEPEEFSTFTDAWWLCWCIANLSERRQLDAGCSADFVPRRTKIPILLRGPQPLHHCLVRRLEWRHSLSRVY